jgi:hypothetical protein
MDVVQGGMKKTENKFKNYIENSKDCYIWTIIMLEFIALLAILLLW